MRQLLQQCVNEALGSSNGGTCMLIFIKRTCNNNITVNLNVLAPLFSKERQEKIGICRRVSLKSVTGEYDGIYYRGIMSHSNNNRSRHWHGFMEGKSGSTKTLELLMTVRNKIDKDKPNDLVCVNFGLSKGLC